MTAVLGANMIDLAAKQLQRDIHDVLTKAIINKEVNDYREMIRPMVEKAVKRTAIHISTYDDFNTCCSHLKAFIEFSDEKGIIVKVFDSKDNNHE